LKYPTADGTSGQFLTTQWRWRFKLWLGSGRRLPRPTTPVQAVTSSATTTINLNSGNVIDLTMAANITSLSVYQMLPASGTPIFSADCCQECLGRHRLIPFTWPNSVYWNSPCAPTTFATVQTAPTLANGANGVTVLALLTTDGGTNWRGWVDGIYPLVAANELYMWGRNGSGNLGQNDTTR